MRVKKQPEVVKPAAVDTEFAAITRVLTTVAERHGGVLNPVDVVAEARSPASPLHRYFEWDDTEAAAQWRIAQAGSLIRRVKFTMVRESAEPKMVNVRSLVSLPADRSKAGGYRKIESVLTNTRHRSVLLETVHKELLAYRTRYAALVELAGVWEAIDEVKAGKAG